MPSKEDTIQTFTQQLYQLQIRHKLYSHIWPVAYGRWHIWPVASHRTASTTRTATEDGGSEGRPALGEGSSSGNQFNGAHDLPSPSQHGQLSPHGSMMITRERSSSVCCMRRAVLQIGRSLHSISSLLRIPASAVVIFPENERRPSSDLDASGRLAVRTPYVLYVLHPLKRRDARRRCDGARMRQPQASNSEL